MSTEATQDTGADEIDLAGMFEDGADDGSQTETQGQDGNDTQTQQGQEEIVLDADGNPVDPASAQANEDELELELDADGNPIASDDPNAQNGVLVIPDNHVVKLNVDGKDIELTFGEMKAGAQKYKGAEKKFEEAAAIRKEYTEKAQTLGTREQQLGQVLQFYIAQSSQFMQQEPNWAELIQNDPQKYLVERHNWEAKQRDLVQARQVQENLKRQQAEQAQASANQRAEQARDDLVKAIPEWSDPQKLAAGAKSIDMYLANQGISPEMRNQIDSAAVLLIARKAMMFDEAIAKQKAARSANGGKVNQQQQQGQPVRRQQQGRVERPGASRSPAQVTASNQNLQRARAQQNFEKNPSVDTLAGFFE